MHTTFATALLAFGASAAAHILPHTFNTRHLTSRRCGEHKPSEAHLSQSLDLFHVETAKVAEDPKAYDFDIEVNVHVHVISSSPAKYITMKQIQDQIQYLNKAFGPYDVSFKHLSTDFTLNGNWSVGGGELAMKKYLRKGTYKDLNLYYTDMVSYGGGEALGYCYFPEPDVDEDSKLFTLDGCIINAQTVPGGSYSPYNLGGTTVHEVGHWFNLFHTFDGGCEEGDEVWDTPAQASPSSGCPKLRDSCPGKPGIDPIHNFMDYSDDACYEGFSLGQRRRMHSSFQTYRV